MLRRFVISLVVLAAAGAPGGAAQVAPQSLKVGPRLGYDLYEDLTSIDAGAALGIDATYFLTRNFGIGAYIDFSRTETDGAFFPAELNFASAGGDSTLVFAVSQPLTVLKYGAQLVGTVPVGGPINPYVLVGAGAYQIELDPQVATTTDRITEFQATIGGGLDFTVGRGATVRLDVRDYILTGFDRERLNPVEPRFRPARFRDVVPPQEPLCGGPATAADPFPSRSCTTHNLVFAVSFQFTPGGAR